MRIRTPTTGSRNNSLDAAATVTGRQPVGTERQLIPDGAHMLIVHVFVHVKPESVDAFAAATLENGRNSVREPGVVRFDVVQQEDDPTRFLLIEIYRTLEDPARHKATAHYATWRDTVEPMMAEPRRSVKYRALFPDAPAWERPR
jgi:(4S)-4-hydroxy-5-phosphonooxypentane-2,3-dione isomerase